MPKVTLVLAALLIALGVGGYVISGMASKTALIPAFFGVLYALGGALGLMVESARKHAMHGTAALTLLVIAGTARGFLGSFGFITGAEIARPMAVAVQAITFLLAAAYLGLSVNSFIQARKRRLAQ